MLQVEYFTLAIQLKLLREKKDIFWQELEDARKDREGYFEQFTSHYTKREYLSYTVGRLKEELHYVMGEKENIELSLAYLIANRITKPQKVVSELLPADIDIEHYDEVEIKDKESDIILLDIEIDSIRERLKDSETKLKEFILDKEILDKHREVCRQYQIKQQVYDEVVKDELDVAQKLLLIYRQLKPV